MKSEDLQPQALVRGTESEHPKRTPKGAKWSHHKHKKCPLPKCAFFGTDLRRHLNIHVRKGQLAEEGVEKLLAIVLTGKRQRGKSLKQSAKGRSKKGRFKK